MSNSTALDWRGDESWGSKFWVTLLDPRTNVELYACPATGAISWDPPVGHFVLPPSEEGEWWELSSESHNGLSYYYHTKTKETVWERPEGFIIPLGMLQGTSLSRNDSTKSVAKNGRKSVSLERSSSTGRPQITRQTVSAGPHPSSGNDNAASKRAQLSIAPGLDTIPGSTSDLGLDERERKDRTVSSSGVDSFGRKTRSQRVHAQTVHGHGHYHNHNHNQSQRQSLPKRAQLPTSLDAAAAMIASTSSPISPNSPHMGDFRPPNSPAMTPPRVKLQQHRPQAQSSPHLEVVRPPRKSSSGAQGSTSPVLRLQTTKLSSHKSQPDLHAHPFANASPLRLKMNGKEITISPPQLQRRGTGESSLNEHNDKIALDSASLRGTPPIISPLPILLPTSRDNGNVHPNGSSPVQTNGSDGIQGSPNSSTGLPDPQTQTTTRQPSLHAPHRSLPQTLASEISQFASTDFARMYFATHRRGIIWRRKIPVEEMMAWSKAPLPTPLLQLPKSLHRDAVRAFKAIQLVMGDREVPVPASSLRSTSSLISLGSGHGEFPRFILEEERWLLTQGILHGELRDEIYCQMVKQLNGCPSLESTFKGWQLLCVLLITFPPSKNLEDYLRKFIQERCGPDHSKGRINILAKYALNRLVVISRKGPRGKPPTLSEIASASDAPFNPSIFGEPLDSIMRLQSRTAYADLKVPIVLPFLADGILALGGMQSEGIFRVQGDAEVMAEMKSKIDRGFYSLDGAGGGGICEDPNVLAGLLKLWLRELQDPLIPDEMYGDCVQTAARFRDAQNEFGASFDLQTHKPSSSLTSVDREKERLTQESVKEAKEKEIAAIVARLPTINRRVILFVISFLQLFLDEKVIKSTKMTSANLALVMAPNLLRCRSESMRVVFTNAQYEQIFVHDLLQHLNCQAVDSDYIPTHGMGARSATNKRP